MKVGLAYLYIAPFKSHTDGQKPVYEKGMEAARMISVDLTFDKSEAEAYANNVLVESENTITGGSLTLEVDHFSGDARVMALGVSKVQDGDSYVFRTRNKATPYVGAGMIQVEQVDGKVDYIATWIYKTQFNTQGISASTKGKNTEFKSTQATGKFMGVKVDAEEAAFIDERHFESIGDAQGWLKQLAGISAA